MRGALFGDLSPIIIYTTTLFIVFIQNEPKTLLQSDYSRIMLYLSPSSISIKLTDRDTDESIFFYRTFPSVPLSDFTTTGISHRASSGINKSVKGSLSLRNRSEGEEIRSETPEGRPY